MKKILIILMFYSSFTYSQIGKWEQSNLDYSNDLYGISFTDSLTGWICGENGLIIHTIDGNNWIQQQSQVTVNLYDIFFLDSLNGWACGDSATVLKTTNGGENWQTIPTPLNDRKLVSLEFTNYGGDIYGYLVGDSISLATNDNCQTIYGGQNEQISFDITFYTPYTGFEGLFLSQYMIWFTDDFGITWADLGGFEYNQYGIVRKNVSINWGYNLWTVGEMGSAYFCIEPFQAFYQSQTPDTLDLYEGDVDEYEEIIWAVGEKGEIVYSTDLGISYQKYPSPVLANLYDIEFSGANTGWAVGENGTLLRYDGEWNITKNDSKQLTNKNIEVFPNPFHNSMNINLWLSNNDNIAITFFNLNGKTVFRKENIALKSGNNNLNLNEFININTLIPGFYYIEVIIDNKIFRQKIIKQ